MINLAKILHINFSYLLVPSRVREGECTRDLIFALARKTVEVSYSKIRDSETHGEKKERSTVSNDPDPKNSHLGKLVSRPVKWSSPVERIRR